MVIITYDANEKEQVSEIENYFFMKYYVESLIFDWKKFYDENDNFNMNKTETLDIILNHLNKTEFERLYNICCGDLGYWMGFRLDEDTNERYVLEKILLTENKIVKRYKDYLKYQYRQ